MLQNSFIFRASASFLSLAGIGATSYRYRGILSDFWNKNQKTYLVQASEDSSKMLTGNYSCLLEQEKDDKCHLLKLNFKKEQHISFKEISSSNEKINEEIKKDVFYKLVINKHKIKKEFKNGETKILINDDKNQKITTLKIVWLIESNKQHGPEKEWGDQKLLVKANTSVFSTTTVTPNKCLIGETSSTEEITCSIYSFNDVPSNKNSLDFSKIKKITDLNKVQAGRYYVIDFSAETDQTKKSKLNELKNIATISVKDATTKKTSFNFVSKIIAHIDSSRPETPTKNHALIHRENFIKNENHSTYIIVKSGTTAGSDGFSSNTGSYKCTVGENENKRTDDNCAIIELSDQENTLSKITNSTNLTQAKTLKGSDQKYFKIIANNDIINEIKTWDGTKKIKIVSAGSNQETEYKQLDVLFFVEGNKVKKGKTSFSIVNEVTKKTETELNGISVWNTYKCKLHGDKTANDCDVYKFDKQLNSKNIVASLNSTISKVNAKEDWKNNHHYFIDWKTKKIDFANLTKKNAEIIVEVSNINKIVATAKINFPLTNLNTTFEANNLASSRLLV